VVGLGALAPQQMRLDEPEGLVEEPQRSGEFRNDGVGRGQNDACEVRRAVSRAQFSV